MEQCSIENKKGYPIRWRRELSIKPETTVAFFFDQFKEQIHPGQSIIQWGCGRGESIPLFLSKGLNLNLIETSPYCLDPQARALLIRFSGQVHFVAACPWKLPSSLKPAHWVYCSHLLEYLSEECIEPVLQQMADRMRLGGYISVRLEEVPLLQKGDRSFRTKSRVWWENLFLKFFRIVGEDVVGDGAQLNCKISPK